MSTETITETKPLTLRLNFSWTILGYGLYSFCNWLMLSVVAKLGTPEKVGQYSLGIIIAQPIITFAMLQLRSVQATDAKREYRFSDYFCLRLLCTALAMLIIGGLSFDGNYALETALVILITGIGGAFDSVSDVFYGLFQQHERLDRMAVSMGVKGILSLLGLGVGMALTGSVVWGVVGSVIASALIVVFYDIPNGRHILQGTRLSWAPHWDKSVLKRLSLLALPLGFATVIVAYNTNVPRFAVEHFFGQRQLGFFSAMSSIIKAGSTVVIALGYSAASRLAKLYAAGRLKEFLKLQGKLLLVGVVLGGIAPIAALVAGKQILTLLYKPEYADHLDVFALIMLAGGIGYVASFLSYGITAARQFWIQVAWSLLTFAVLALSAWWLTPLYGLRGAAFSLIIGMTAQLISGLAILLYLARSADRFSSAVSSGGLL